MWIASWPRSTRPAHVIEKIVLTHGHLDHAGGAPALQSALQAKYRHARSRSRGPTSATNFC